MQLFSRLFSFLHCHFRLVTPPFFSWFFPLVTDHCLLVTQLFSLDYAVIPLLVTRLFFSLLRGYPSFGYAVIRHHFLLVMWLFLSWLRGYSSLGCTVILPLAMRSFFPWLRIIVLWFSLGYAIIFFNNHDITPNI